MMMQSKGGMGMGGMGKGGAGGGRGGMPKPSGFGGYPNVDDIPELNESGAPPEGADQQANPVIQALKTLQIFASGLKEQGNPAAEEATQHLLAFAQAITGGAGGEQMPMPEEEPEEESGPAFDPTKPPEEDMPRKKRGVAMANNMKPV